MFRKLKIKKDTINFKSIFKSPEISPDVLAYVKLTDPKVDDKEQ